MITMRTLLSVERAVKTLQQMLTRSGSVKNAKKTLWERCVDAAGTL